MNRELAGAIACCVLLGLGAAACSTADSDTLDPSAPGSDESPQTPDEQPDCTDTETDPLNCGACGRECSLDRATPACLAGECVVATCDDGFEDADGNPANGCERELPDEPDEPDEPEPEPEPEACTTTCGTEGTVGAGGICVPPAEQCNLIDDNCNGLCDEGRPAGCRIAVHRGVSDELGHLFTTDLAAVTTEPFRIEQQDNFALYTDDLPGSQTAYLCAKDDGTHLVTASAVCEGAGTLVMALGNWATSAECGATPLYRLWQASSNDHFYTLSPEERDNAVDQLGYVFEGIPGYVWLEP